MDRWKIIELGIILFMLIGLILRWIGVDDHFYVMFTGFLLGGFFQFAKGVRIKRELNITFILPLLLAVLIILFSIIALMGVKPSLTILTVLALTQWFLSVPSGKKIFSQHEHTSY